MPQAVRPITEPKEHKRRDPLSPQTVQCIVCALLMLCAFGLYRSGSPVFAALREKYSTRMQTDYCADGVWTAAQRLAQNAAEAAETAVQTIAEIGRASCRERV